jgi:porin-like protein
MKMVKSLLLGSAAGVVAVAGAQAADLPVKAAPVQYVKICTLYGAGFYYVPGTDMCIKIGGWARAEYAWHTNGSSVLLDVGDVNNRNTNNSWWRIRGYITADAREQSAYGTVRSYIAIGLSTNSTGIDNASNQFDANRAFVQWAGFTFGRAQSFYDFYPGAATSYFGFYPQSDTGDGGKEVLGYTAQFGNGWSATVAAETRRTTQIVGQLTGPTFSPITGNPLTFGALSAGTINGGTSFAATGYGGWQVPDITGNIRVDQAWGSAQISGALHQVNAAYYNNAATALEPTGNPDDKWGFAVAGGLKLNAPMFGTGDYFHTQVNYTEGALRYLFQNPNGNWWMQNDSNVAWGILSDGVYGGTSAASATATDINLTTAWGVNAAYEHFWSPQWRTSLHGGYYEVRYNSQANAILCSLEGDGAGVGGFAVANAGCNNDWNTWWIGSRTQWNVTKDFYIGLDVAYQQIHSAQSSDGLIFSPQIPATTNILPKSVSNEDNWVARFRVHRDFYP